MADSLKILKSMYYSDTVVCLGRKRLKIEKTLAVAHKKQKTLQSNAQVAKLVDALP